jgi:aerobic C4-dicarboxylate transport protein
MIRRTVFRHLYFQVLVAIILGACLGYFYPSPPPLYLDSSGTVITAPATAASASFQPMLAPTNIVQVIETNRPNLRIDRVSATPPPDAIYQVTFQKKVGIALRPLGDAFIKLIRMILAPIIFTTVVVGMAGMGSFKRVGRVGLKSILYFEVATTAALIIGWLVVKWFQPGVGVNADPAKLDTKAIAQYVTASQGHTGFVDFLITVIPTSVVDAFARGEIIQVLFFSVLFGFALSVMGERGRPITSLLEQVADVLMKIMSWIVKLAPIAAFGAITYTTASLGIESLKAQFKLMACVYLTSALFIVAVLGTLMKLNGLSLWGFLKFIREELFIVLGTASSESVLPRMLIRLEQIGCARPVVRLVLPAGYSFNMDGSSIYLTMAAIFIAQATNAHLTLWQEVTVILVCLVTSKGAAGVVGSAFIALAATLSSLHTIPIAGMVLILGVDRLMSEARAITNLIGNGVATLLLARWEGELDMNKAREMLGRKTPPSAEATLAQSPAELRTNAAEQLRELKE